MQSIIFMDHENIVLEIARQILITTHNGGNIVANLGAVTSDQQCAGKPNAFNTWRASIMAGIAVLSIGVVQADAQSTLAPMEAQTTFTPIEPTNQSQRGIAFASLGPSQSQPQISSPMPRFDMREAAQRYVALVHEADRISGLPNLSSHEIAQSLSTTAQVSNKGISEGVGAYATHVAASNAEFASGLRTVANIMGRDAVLARLKSDPDQFLAMISGSGQAAREASGALVASQAKLAHAQEILGEAAYSVQTQSWSQSIVDAQESLAAHRHAATQPLPENDGQSASFSTSASTTPINGRYLLAASYQILGDDVAATQILDKPLGRMCMNRVQLNVRQCLAASQHPYEHLFCLSQHSFGETLGCVKDVVK
jgi:hypothetical protein